MNICPVLRSQSEPREGVLSEPDEAEGLGKFGFKAMLMPHTLLKRGGAKKILMPHTALKKHKRHRRRPVAGRLAGLYGDYDGDDPGLGKFGFKRVLMPHTMLGRGGAKKLLMPHTMMKRHGRHRRRVPAAMVARHVGLSGLYGEDPGLGKLRLGKKFKKLGKVAKKIVKSKAFKFAAIAAATYFTAGAAAPMLSKFAGKGGGGLLSKAGGLFGKKNRKGLVSAAQTYGATRMLPAEPGSEYDTGESGGYGGGYSGGGGGGGGGYGMNYAGFSPGMTDEEEVQTAEGRAKGTGLSLSKMLVPLAIGIPLMLALGGGHGRRR